MLTPILYQNVNYKDYRIEAEFEVFYLKFINTPFGMHLDKLNEIMITQVGFFLDTILFVTSV